MKLAIISDIHDNLVNLEKCLSWCKAGDISEIICLGDITNEETLKHLANNFSGTIHLIRGNMEIYEENVLKDLFNIHYLGRFGTTDITGKKIGMCHEPFYIDEVLKADSRLDMIFYGHTHKPWMEKTKGVSAANPGTLGGVFQKATFAVWDSESGFLELMVLENL